MGDIVDIPTMPSFRMFAPLVVLATTSSCLGSPLAWSAGTRDTGGSQESSASLNDNESATSSSPGSKGSTGPDSTDRTTTSAGSTAFTEPGTGSLGSTTTSVTSVGSETTAGASTTGTMGTSTGTMPSCAVGCGPQAMCNMLSGLCEGLYGCTSYDPLIDRIDLVTYSVSSSVTLADAAGVGTIGGCTALASDAISGEVYLVVTDGNGANRSLGTVNPMTGGVSIIGALAENVASLAVDDAGTLYALSGQIGMTQNALFTVDSATAALTIVVDLANDPANNTDGEALAFSPMTGLAYRWSGNGSPKLLTSIDLASMVETPIAPTLVPTGEVLAGVFLREGPLENRFLITTRDNEAISVASDGTYVDEGSFSPASSYYKGLAFGPI